MFSKEFVPQTLRDVWRTEYEQLRQDTMTVSKYAIRFNELACHASILLPTVRERVRRFIEGLDYDLKICMARKLQTDSLFQQVVEIARRIDGVLGDERESKEAKRSQSSRGFSGFYSSSMSHYSGGSSNRRAQSVHQITRGALVSSYSACNDPINHFDLQHVVQ
ncbi:uncharacterized protein [Nicotiana tomentosiformis]|uniref:uncharacterized protein n=1 Tax=Nicotiana tomentosiformis TaxID=4098 RepID=UPI00388CC37E